MMTDADNNNIPSLPKRLIGIGASAGGLEAIESMFRAMPIDLGVSYVIVQHLSPDFKSLMHELLSRFTRMPVVVLGEENTIEKDTIYVLPPKRDVVVIGNKLVTSEKPPSKLTALIIDKFFESMAKSWKGKAVGIVLSGTGVDGTVGASYIFDAGGLVIAQDPDDARFDGMPMSVMGTGCIHRVCPASEIPSELITLMAEPISDLPHASDAVELGQMINEPNAQKVIDLLRQTYDVDFEQYKPSSVFRRIQRRVSMRSGFSSLHDYLNVLVNQPEELNSLYKDLLIGVTGFFRDKEAFDSLCENVIKVDLSKLPLGQEYRVWVCGCATGEEAYSLGMEIMEQFEILGRAPSCKIFASDLNKDSLDIASEGVYSSQAIQEVPQKYREKYFVPIGGDYFKVTPALRKNIIFSEHNLLRSPPFTRINLVSCRNLMIYLRQEVQSTVLSSFNFSLVNGGTLFLGSSETLGNHIDDYEVIDRNNRVFRKMREGRLTIPTKRAENSRQLMSVDYNRQKNDSRFFMGRVYQTLLDKHVHAGLLISESGDLIECFGTNADVLKIDKKAEPLDHATDLIVSDSLRLLILEKLKSFGNEELDSKPMEFEWSLDGKIPRHYRCSIRRFYDKVLSSAYFMIAVQPKIQAKHVERVYRNTKDFSLTEESQRFIEELKAELSKTKESLQTNAEELETSNEELQASNEELQASNEELQSTNEELHSVNEELFTVNAELEHKISELDRTSRDLRNLVDSTQIGTVFLDGDYKIRIFTPRITNVFSLVQGDVGRDLRAFTPRLDDPQLWDDIEKAYKDNVIAEVVLFPTQAGRPTYIRRCGAYKSSSGRVEGVLISYVEVDMSHVSRGMRLMGKVGRLFG